MLGLTVSPLGQVGKSIATATVARTYGGMAIKCAASLFVNRRGFSALSGARPGTTFSNRPTGMHSGPGRCRLRCVCGPPHPRSTRVLGDGVAWARRLVCCACANLLRDHLIENQ